MRRIAALLLPLLLCAAFTLAHAADLDGGATVRLSGVPVSGRNVKYTTFGPDGRTVLYAISMVGSNLADDLYSVQPRVLTPIPLWLNQPLRVMTGSDGARVTPDGTHVLFSAGNWDLETTATARRTTPQFVLPRRSRG